MLLGGARPISGRVCDDILVFARALHRHARLLAGGEVGVGDVVHDAPLDA